ncbi:hypothetical protein FRC08_010433 [Ceratobasidium sp. 394]|nr:hypothetical protein FRC08_010433 [Ceratobasidium sp. 394]
MDAPPNKKAAPRRVKVGQLPDPIPPEYMTLTSRLKAWREEVVERIYGPFFPLGGLVIIGDPQVERIAGLALMGALPDDKVFRAQVEWCYHDEYGAEVLPIVHEVFPSNVKGTLSTPSTHSTPASVSISLPPTPDSPVSSDSESAPKRQATTRVYKCRACGGTGHNGKHQG